MMLTIGVVAGVVISAPVFFLIGVFAARDRRVTHEPADITPALRRSP